MKFKMGSQNGDKTNHDSIHDSTMTSNPVPARPSSSSGLYDVSKMTNIPTPTDSFGVNASKSTKQRGKELERRDRNLADSIRALLLAVAFPLIAGAGYLIFTGKQLDFSGSTLSSHAEMAPEKPRNREPATSATLPIGKVDTHPLQEKPVDLSQILLTQKSAIPQVSADPANRFPVQLELDENGQLVSPFSMELDEEGNQVARLEVKAHLTFLPPIPYGPFERVSSFSEAKPSEEFMKLIAEARPYFSSAFKYTPEEVRRFNFLSSSLPEIGVLMDVYLPIARSLLGRLPVAANSLDPSVQSSEALDQLHKELDWIEPTVIVSQITGDRTYDERLKASALEWSRTYQPTGDVHQDSRVLNVAIAYEYLQANLKPEENSAIRSFLMKMADLQLVKFKSHKVYDIHHANHIYLMTALGGALRDPRILEHAIFQYSSHIERAPMFMLESFGYEQLVALRWLLDSTVILERLGFRFYQKQVGARSLARAVEVLKRSSQIAFPWDYVLTSVSALYFEPSLFETVQRLSRANGNRFATTKGITLVALRKESSSLKPVNERIPSSIQKSPGSRVPNRLPEKRGR